MAADSAFHDWLAMSNECTGAPSLETTYTVDLSLDSDTAMRLSTEPVTKDWPNRPVSALTV